MSDHLNGTETHEPVNGQHQASRTDITPIAVEVFSIKEGTSAFVRILSASYGGIWTHYFKNRGSKYCAGPECMYLCSKLERTWKGYCAAQVWLPSVKKYRPCVLELTERLEQDMRGLFERGQVWECWRQSPIAGKRQPTQGKLQPAQVFKNLPPEFDWQPVVRNLYHCAKMDFSVKNPLAPRVVANDVEDDAPLGTVLEPKKECTPEEWEAFRERMKQFNAQKKTPSDKQRGR